jgi:tRNA-dependent cyclodipeptide synthase
MSVSNLQATRYKARGPGTKDHRSDQYARLLISVGQPYHEGAKFAAALKWADDNFNHKVIFLADTLQRYNLIMAGMDPVEAMKQSRLDGDQWLERNASLIKDVAVFRWDQAINHENYLLERKKIDRLYQEDKLIKNEIDKAVYEVAIRRQIKPEALETFLEISVQYLLEEAAGKAVENEIFKGVSAYPGSTPNIWSLFTSLPEAVVPKGLINDHTITLEIKKVA